jgi:hypothetical protein
LVWERDEFDTHTSTLSCVNEEQVEKRKGEEGREEEGGGERNKGGTRGNWKAQTIAKKARRRAEKRRGRTLCSKLAHSAQRTGGKERRKRRRRKGNMRNGREKRNGKDGISKVQFLKEGKMKRLG